MSVRADRFNFIKTTEEHRKRNTFQIFLEDCTSETNQSLINVDIPDEISANRVQQNIKK